MKHDRVHVVAAVVQNQCGEVLITLRPDHVHQGGLWEFPGGKVELSEPVFEALVRELDEETGIRIERARPLIRITHDYPDKSVLLDVWLVESYQGVPYGKEGQQLEWVEVNLLNDYPFPEANRPIIQALGLPTSYLVTPEPGNDKSRFLDRLDILLSSGIQLVQLRAKSPDATAYQDLAVDVIKRCHQRGVKVLANAEPEIVTKVNADGVHLTSERLLSLSERPVGKEWLCAASCHDNAQVNKANQLQLDFIVVSPVLQTDSHPRCSTIGWGGFNKLTELANMPVYALGGMRSEHMSRAFECGGQGIAAISSFWDGE
ncbi:MAG: Nudix family hydrolase [Gammaproteobacteria bacterium]